MTRKPRVFDVGTTYISNWGSDSINRKPQEGAAPRDPKPRRKARRRQPA
jgi:hypothetical protein